MPKIDITGQRFGRLVAIAPTDRRVSGNVVWRFRCDCGVEKETPISNVRSGNTRSCGCFIRETRKKNLSPLATLTHGQSRPRSPTYRVWAGMIGRCLIPTDSSFKDYGGRGITVCDRWRRFEDFLADMGERPAGRSIDRINNDGDYEPGNCRWATPTEQRLNQRPRAPMREAA
jgi:hypothetical protein